jgi:hypothetical protein
MKYGLQVLMNLKTSPFTNASLPKTLYVCETWYIILRKQHRLREIENSLLRLYLEQRRSKRKPGGKKTE